MGSETQPTSVSELRREIAATRKHSNELEAQIAERDEQLAEHDKRHAARVQELREQIAEQTGQIETIERGGHRRELADRHGLPLELVERLDHGEVDLDAVVEQVADYARPASANGHAPEPEPPAAAAPRVIDVGRMPPMAQEPEAPGDWFNRSVRENAAQKGTMAWRRPHDQ